MSMGVSGLAFVAPAASCASQGLNDGGEVLHRRLEDHEIRGADRFAD